MLEEILADIAPDWETDGYGLDSNLICPHGDMIEQDATACPDGDPNPLMTMGMI